MSIVRHNEINSVSTALLINNTDTSDVSVCLGGGKVIINNNGDIYGVLTSTNTTSSTSSITGSVLLSGGIGISNTTDATSSTNGGSFTTAGGFSAAKKIFVGTDLSVGGSVTSGTWNATTISISKGGTGETTASSAFDALAPTTAQGDLIYRNATTNTRLPAGTSGQVLTSGGTGANPSWTTLVTGVSSVSGDSVLINNVSSTGAVTLTLASANANLVFASPDGSSGSGTYRSLLNNDLPTVNVVKGGTGVTTLTSNSILVGNGTGSVLTPANLTFATNVLSTPKLTSTDTTTSSSSTIGAVLLSGGLSLSNTTDATSSTNGGTFTTAGGISTAKKLFVGTDLSVGGNVTSGTWNGTTIGIAYGGTGATTAGGAFDALAPTTTQGDIIYRNATTNVRLPPGTAGQVLTSGGAGANPSWSSVSSAVSSVSGDSVLINNVASTGAVTLTLASASANLVFASPDGSSGSGTYRSLLNADLPTVSIAKGGTGATTAGGAFDALAPTTTQGDIIYRNATTNVRLPPGTAGQVLTSGGTGANPSWSTVTSGVSSITGDSVLINNVASTGAVTLTLASASANLVFASPDGSSGSGTYRSLLNADLPTVSIAKGGTGATTAGGAFDALAPTTTQGDIIYRNATTNVRLPPGTAGQVLTSGGTGANPSWSTVTSGVSSITGDSVLINNVASTGAVTLTLASASANLVFASPDGSSGSGTYRSLLNADLPTVSVAKGGTGNTTLTTNAVLLGNGTSAVQSPSSITYATSTLTLPKLTSNDSTASTSNTTGAVLLSGGIGISNTTDATSSTNGGTFTSAGGFAVAKNAFIGGELHLRDTGNTVNVAITPNTEDIVKQVSFTGANNQVSAADVTGLVFSSSTTRSFKVQLSCIVTATSSLFAQFNIEGIYNGSTWYFVSNYIGDDTLVTFSITNAGQIQYTSANYSGFSSLIMKFRALTVTV